MYLLKQLRLDLSLTEMRNSSYGADLLVYTLFLVHANGMWKLPGQGSTLSHNSDSDSCHDDAGSLTCCDTREPLLVNILKIY